MKKILFVTQNLNRTGSEMVLWYLLKNLPPLRYKIYVFCLTKGELFDELPSPIEKSVTYKHSGLWNKKILRSALKFFGIDPFEYQLTKIHDYFKPDIWYMNTIAIPQAFPVAEKLKVKVVTHFHELLYAFTFIQNHELKRILAQSDTCIACSEEVQYKIREMGHQNIKLQHSFIDVDIIHTDVQKVKALRSKFNIQDDDFVWVISGGATYMKGMDYIIPILEFFEHFPVKIIWIGKLPGVGLNYYVQKVAENKYPGRLFFTGPLSSDYYDHLALGNGFLMLSREESFSLVLVEAAYLGIPIVATNTGIAGTFITEGMGKVVDSYDIKAITKAMEGFQNYSPDKEKLKQAAMIYSVQRQLPLFDQLLAELTD